MSDNSKLVKSKSLKDLEGQSLIVVGMGTVKIESDVKIVITDPEFW